MIRRCIILVSLVSWLATPAAAQFDSVFTDTIAPGVVHSRLVVNRVPWSIHLVRVDLRQPDLVLEVVHAGDAFRSRERLSSMAQRHASDSLTVVAGINADFFSLATGEVEDNEVMAGRVIKGLGRAESAGDVAHRPRSQFALTDSGAAVFERFAFSGTILTAAGDSFALRSLNTGPNGNGVALYTAAFGAMTPPDSGDRHTATVTLAQAGQRGDTAVYQVTGPPIEGGGVMLTEGAALLAGAGVLSPLGGLGPGTELRVVTRFMPDRGPLKLLVGGWPRLVVHGQSVADSADALEGTRPSFSVTRHPRSGIGITRDSTTLMLITVDGRQESSSGMSLAEFAGLMQTLGVFEGLNLDGGGSTTMLVGDRVANRPSDPTGERAIGNGLLILRRRQP